MLAVLEDGESVASTAIANVTSPRQITAELTRILDSEESAAPSRAPPRLKPLPG